MTALNSLEILNKFFGNNSTSGIALEMVRNGLFEEQLKLASQLGQSSPKEPQRDGSLPMIKKTLPVGPPVPAQTPEDSSASRRETSSGSKSASPASNASSSPPPGASEESSSPSEGPKAPPADASSTGQNPSPTSGESQTADQNESPELPTLVFSEDSSGGAGEEESAGLPASGLLTEVSPKEDPKTEETSDQDIPAVAAGEGASWMAASPIQAPIPSEPASPEDRSPTEQAPSAFPVEGNGQHSGSSPKNFVPGPLPGAPNQGMETFSGGENMPHLAGASSEQTGTSGAAGVEARGNSSGPAIPPGMNPLAGTPQDMAVSPPAAAVPAGLSAERAASAGSSNASAGGSESVSGVGQTTDRGAAASSSANPAKAKSAADPEASSQEAGIQRVRFVQRVARAFQSLQDGGGSVRLRLHPPELGSLRVELTVREGVLRARMEVENTAARSAILEHLPMLRERLAQQDIRIEQFEVEIGGQTNGGASHQSDNPAAEQRNASFSPPANRSRPPETNPAASRGNPLTASESTKLNVVI